MINWNSIKFFSRLLEANRFAQRHGFRFHEVSGLEGFHSTLTDALRSKALFCVCDASEGSMNMDNTPNVRRVKTVFMAMRHPVADESARNECMAIMRELFRQMMSVLIREKTRLEENCIYVDPHISFSEIDRYFFNGAACAFFQIAVDTYVDLSFNDDEWTSNPLKM